MVIMPRPHFCCSIIAYLLFAIPQLKMPFNNVVTMRYRLYRKRGWMCDFLPRIISFRNYRLVP